MVTESSTGISYEGFGYDAMLVIGRAIIACRDKGKVTRKNVSEIISSGMPFVGTSGVYEFEDGENKLAQYDILKATIDEQGLLQWALDEVVSAVRLQEIRGGG